METRDGGMVSLRYQLGEVISSVQSLSRVQLFATP